MSTALKVIQARVAQEDNAFSGVFNTSDLSHNMSSIPYVRVGGHVFRRWDKAKKDDIYVKILPNGLITILTIDCDDDSIDLGTSPMLAENGVLNKYFYDYKVSLADKKVEVMIPVDNDDDEEDCGIDTRKADGIVSTGMAVLSKLDAFIGTIPKSFELLGSTVARQTSRNTDPDFMFSYKVQGKLELVFELEDRSVGKSKAMSIPALTVHIDVNNGVNESDGSVKSFSDSKCFGIDRLTNFDLIMSWVKAALKSEGVTSFAVTTFEYDIDHKNHKVSIQNKKAFEKELNDLVAKYRFTIGKK